ncbi:MAG: hypothetical protein IJO45_00500 [Oscillospiraceae bacterium]|nr:hypothetical protein [Oscillospiraceae bacterium]
MFRDASEELERLQAELLAEDEPVELPPEEPPEETLFFEEYEDTRPAQGPAVYQNYSNDYGKNLRNYASGYRAYNSDTTDEDLEEYSEAVREGNTSRGSCLLAVIAVILALAILGVVAYGFLYTRGYIG